MEFGWQVDADDTEPGVEKDVQENNDNASEAFPWLQRCILSISPTLEIMALAQDDRMVILNREYLLHWIKQVFHCLYLIYVIYQDVYRGMCQISSSERICCMFMVIRLLSLIQNLQKNGTLKPQEKFELNSVSWCKRLSSMKRGE